MWTKYVDDTEYNLPDYLVDRIMKELMTQSEDNPSRLFSERRTNLQNNVDRNSIFSPARPSTCLTKEHHTISSTDRQGSESTSLEMQLAHGTAPNQTEALL